MKKLLRTSAACVLSVLLAACGAAKAAVAPLGADTALLAPGNPASGALPVLSPDKPVAISMWLTTRFTQPADDNKLTKLLKSKLGVTLIYDVITPDNADAKISVMLAGGDYPDLLSTVDSNARLILGGAMIPLDGYLRPGAADALYEHVQPYWNRLSIDAGSGKHIYVLPDYNRYYGKITGGTNYSASGFWIQKAVLRDAGYPSLDNMTLDKYFNLIERYMAKYPIIDGQPAIGFEIMNPPGREWVLTNPPEYLDGAPNNGGVIIEGNNHASIFANKGISKQYYQFLNQMYAKGLIDPESFTQTLDQYLVKLATGRVLGMYDQRWDFGNAYDALVSEGKDERTWVSTMPVFEGKTPYYADREVMNINQGFGVSVSCKKPDIAVSFLNTMMSEQWQKILSWGIEGEDYLVGPDGMFTRTNQMRGMSKDTAWRSSNKLEALLDLLPKHQGTFSDGNAYSPDDQPAEFFATLSAYDENFLTNYNKQTWRDFLNQPPENPVYYPAWSIPLPDGSEAQAVNQLLTDTSLQYLPLAILSDPKDFDNIWDEYTDAISKINIKAYEDVINAGIQDRIAQWGP